MATNGARFTIPTSDRCIACSALIRKELTNFPYVLKGADGKNSSATYDRVYLKSVRINDSSNVVSMCDNCIETWQSTERPSWIKRMVRL